MNHIKWCHHETAKYMQCCSWSGGFVCYRAGVSTYTYTSSNGWTVTMNDIPHLHDPVYMVSVKYEQQSWWWFMPDKTVVNWQGTWQDGVVRQTSYRYTP